MTEEDDIAIKKDAEKSKQSLQPLKQLEESEDHDVKRNGKNQHEPGGNDRGSYKHRAPQGPPQAPQPPPQRQQFDANPILFQNQQINQGTDNLSPANLNK